MVLYYALGGGLGHLARAKKVLDALCINEFAVVTADQQVPSTLFSPDELLIVPAVWSKSPEKLMPFLAEFIKRNGIEQVLLDTFPIGLLGELSQGFASLNVEVVYIARYLNWSSYAEAVKLSGVAEALRFDNCLVIDHLHSQQIAFIESHCEHRQELNLVHANGKIGDDALSAGKWLIAHSKPVNELSELLEYSRDIAHIEGQTPKFLVCTAIAKANLPQEFYVEDVEVINYYPASRLFAKASKLFTACGYNLMNETILYADKHHFLPFCRRYDDQFLRAERRRNSASLLADHETSIDAKLNCQ